MTLTMERIARIVGAAALTALIAGVGFQGVSAQGPGGPGGGGGPMGRRGGPGGPGFGGPGGLPMMLGQLNLTSEQQDRVKQILESHREEQRAMQQREMTAHQALQDAITASTFDESAVRTRAAELANVDADVAVAQARIYAEVFQILTPDQQKTLQDLQATMKSRMQQGHQGRGQRP
jgi:Spy/CpxP family protein refolding chaperone